MGGQLVSHKSPETTVRPCWRSFHVSRSIYVEAAATAGPGSFVAKGDEAISLEPEAPAATNR
jgi:hypothetical protein